MPKADTKHARATTKSWTITDLYRDFAKAFAAVEATPGDLPAGATNECEELARRIVRTSAFSVEEATLKVRVALWSANCYRYKKLEDLDDWSLDDDDEVNALMSLRDDLKRLMSADATTDYQLVELGEQFEASWAAEQGPRAQLDAAGEVADDAPEWKAFEKAHARTSRVVDKIEAIQARTLAGLRVKARAVSWCHSGESPFQLSADEKKPSTADLRIAQSIIADLLRAA